jgi:hypothetical protein
MARTRQRRRCAARTTNGKPCRAFAVTGLKVCSAHGGTSPQARDAARRRRGEAGAERAYAAAYARWQRELEEWQAARIVTAARIWDIDPRDVNPLLVGWLVEAGDVPPETDAPKIRVDRRYGPRTPRQLATRAARQAERRAAVPA